jgi:hypothetical protein
MTSTLYVFKKDADQLGERMVATFKLPVKYVFGRRFCDTDGSIGYNTDVTDREMIEVVDECRLSKLDARDLCDLEKLETAALGGFHFWIEWRH